MISHNNASYCPQKEILVLWRNGTKINTMNNIEYITDCILLELNYSLWKYTDGTAVGVKDLELPVCLKGRYRNKLTLCESYKNNKGALNESYLHNK